MKLLKFLKSWNPDLHYTHCQYKHLWFSIYRMNTKTSLYFVKSSLFHLKSCHIWDSDGRSLLNISYSMSSSKKNGQFWKGFNSVSWELNYNQFSFLRVKLQSSFVLRPIECHLPFYNLYCCKQLLDHSEFYRNCTWISHLIFYLSPLFFFIRWKQRVRHLIVTVLW